MDLDDLIITMFVTIDDELNTARQRLHAKRLRQSGPAPKLADAEVLTMECAGEMLGLDCDKHLFAYFARHYRHFFPALARTHRTTFARQAANLWHVKELIWRRLVAEAAPAGGEAVLGHDRLHVVDSMPVPVCRFARATFCRRFRGAARYGKDHGDRQTFYGFRLHARHLAGPHQRGVPDARQPVGAVRAAAADRVGPVRLRRPGRPQLL